MLKRIIFCVSYGVVAGLFLCGCPKAWTSLNVLSENVSPYGKDINVNRYSNTDGLAYCALGHWDADNQKWVTTATLTPNVDIDECNPVLVDYDESLKASTLITSDKVYLRDVAVDVDQDSDMHIAYVTDTYIGDTKHVYTYYVHQTNGVWGSPALVLDSPFPNGVPWVDIAVSASGEAHIVQSTFWSTVGHFHNTVYYWSSLDGAQLLTNIDDGAVCYKHDLSIALDDAGLPGVGYNTYTLGYYFHYYGDASWGAPDVISTDYDSMARLVFGDGKFLVAGLELATTNFEVLERNGLASWSLVNGFGVNTSSDLAVDPSELELVGMVVDEDGSGFGNDSGIHLYVEIGDSGSTGIDKVLEIEINDVVNDVGKTSAGGMSGVVWNPARDERWMLRQHPFVSLYTKDNLCPGLLP